MAFVVRRPPISIAATLKQISKPASQLSPATRSFHQQTASAQRRQTSYILSSIAKSRQNVPSIISKRTYMQAPEPAVNPNNTGALWQKLLVGGALVGGTMLAINVVFNRETREDGGMPPFERSYLNDTFLHTGLGIGVIGVAASALHRNGWSIRIMSMNPWLVIGGSLVASVGCMMGTYATSPDK